MDGDVMEKPSIDGRLDVSGVNDPSTFDVRSLTV